MNPDQLLTEIQRAVEGRRPDGPAVRRRLDAIANRPGAAELLARIVRTGDPVDAQLAALALPHARSELVRRGLRRDVQRTSGNRRALLLASLTDEELEEALTRLGHAVDDDLVDASGMLAVNSPRVFVELLCESVPIVGIRVVEHIERVRQSFAINAASVYGPLLERRLSTEARRRVLGILGREPGEPARRLLEREQVRARDDDEQRVLRRERMRQATLEADGLAPAVPEGFAMLSPPGPRDSTVLEIVESLDDGRCVATTVIMTMAGRVETFARPLDESAERVRAQASQEHVVLSLGQARGLIEALPSARRKLLTPLLDRLVGVSIEEVPRPTPGAGLDAAQSAALACSAGWKEWRPLATWVRWPDEVLLDAADLPSHEWPGTPQQVQARAREELARCFGSRGMAPRLAAGLRMMALWMNLRGDPLAGAVATEALQVARRRPGELTLALTKRELTLQLWSHASLPESFQASVREALRQRLRGDEPPDWSDVVLLDLAQAGAEGLARARGVSSETPGLAPPSQEELDAAIAVSRRARESLREAPVLQAVRSGRVTALADEARAWLDGQPVEAAFQIVQLVSSTCLAGCPHDCLRRRPRSPALDVWQGPCPQPGD